MRPASDPLQLTVLRRLLRGMTVGSAAVVLSLSVFHWVPSQDIAGVSLSQQVVGSGSLRAERLGLAHIAHPSMSDGDLRAERYGNATLIGAGWHRFPVYWSDIEREPGERNWENFDRMVADSIAAGLQINLILLNVPEFARAEGNIANIYAPVFADGSDTYAPGKRINPDNLWAGFAAAAVQRYRPGGTLATQLHWGPGIGVRVWEAWNEPDLSMFWGGTESEYARLLKVTYLAVRAADSSARVMTSGFAYADARRGDWFAKIMAEYATDPDAPVNNWYFDMVALHSYVDPYRTPMLVRQVRETMARYGIDRPVWVNESGVPVWDDYPGPTWALGQPGTRQYRRTMRQQANYVIMSTAMAWAEGADLVFIHQLYDDCAASPVGTNFPPHQGQLCTGFINLCSGEAFGMFRNRADADCFREHPQPGTARPAASAYYRMASIFGDQAFTHAGSIDLAGRGRAIVFHGAPALTGVAYDPAQIGRNGTLAQPGRITERIWVMWNSGLRDLDIEIPAVGGSARLYTLSDDYYMTARDGAYRLRLPAVRAEDYPPVSDNELANIDGEPYIFVEQVIGGWTGGAPALTIDSIGPVDPQNNPIGGTPTPSGTATVPASTAPTATPEWFAATPSAAPVSTAVPTLDPMLDSRPPIPRMDALPATSPASFAVSWSAEEESGIAEYIVWVRVDGGEWEPWLTTTDTSAVYNGSAGHRYEFALWARDLAGNWSEVIDLVPMTGTEVA